MNIYSFDTQPRREATSVKYHADEPAGESARATSPDIVRGRKRLMLGRSFTDNGRTFDLLVSNPSPLLSFVQPLVTLTTHIIDCRNSTPPPGTAEEAGGLAHDLNMDKEEPRYRSSTALRQKFDGLKIHRQLP